MWRATGLERYLARRERQRLVLWGYFDESGKFADSDFVCLCGYLADERWEQFCFDWKLALERHGILSLHMSALDWKNEKLVAGLDEFAALIRKHALYGFSVAVDAQYYRSMPIEKKKLLGNKDPRDFTFHRLLRIVRDRLKSDGKMTGFRWSLTMRRASPWNA